MSEAKEGHHNKVQEFALKAVKSFQSYGEVSPVMHPVATDELGANKSLQQLASEVPLDATASKDKKEKKEKKEKSGNSISGFAIKAVKSFQSYGEVSPVMRPVATDELGANKSLQQLASEVPLEDESKKTKLAKEKAAKEKAAKEKAAAKKEKKGFFAKLKKALLD